MADSAKSPPALELTSEDVERLPAGLRGRLGSMEGGRGGDSLKRWVVIGARSDRQAALIRRAATTAGRIAEHRRREMTERNIETLVDLFLADEERAETDREIEQDNAELRARYMREVPAWTAARSRALLSGPKPGNPSEPASRWKREKRIFAVRGGRTLLYPCFQFADGLPLPVIGKALKRLPDDMTPWQTAFWFRSGNGWLDGRAPQEALGDEDRLLEAADRMREPAIG